jgi:hypothetical protein
MPASFNGLPIFGRVFSMVTSENARDEQRIAVPGANGTGSLDMGERGRQTAVKGMLYGTQSDLIVSDLAFRSAKDGRYYVLVDTFSRTWVNVKLHRYVPMGRILADPFYGYIQHYDAEFTHAG